MRLASPRLDEGPSPVSATGFEAHGSHECGTLVAFRPELPARPYIPPLCATALSCSLVSYLLMGESWRAFLDEGMLSARWVVAAVLAALVLLAVSFLLKRVNVPASTYLRFACVGVLIAAIASCAASSLRYSSYLSLKFAPQSSLSYIVQGDPRKTSQGYSMSARVLDSEGQLLASVSVTCEEPYEEGCRLRLVGRLSDLGDSDWARSRYMAGEVLGIKVIRVASVKEQKSSRFVERLRLRAAESIEPAASDARALLAGLVIGRTTELNASVVSDDISATGLSHMVAVSGSHLAIVSSMAVQLLSAFQLSKRKRNVALIALNVLYVFLSGGSVSAIRSVVMVALSLAEGSAGRRSHGISALACTVIVMLALDASTVYDLGFELSCLSVLFILVFASYVSCCLERLGLPRWLSQGLACTLCAQAATLPLTVSVFGTLSLVAPLSNILLAPLMSALLCFSLPVCLLIAFVPAFGFVLELPLCLARVCLFLISLLAQLPFASIYVDSSFVLPLVLYGAAIVLYACWLNTSPVMLGAVLILALGAIMLHFAYWAFWAPASITVLDVGQADSILIRDGPSAVLVDAGVDEEAARALGRNNVYHLDAIVITHWDSDHYGGLPEILKSVAVDKLYVAFGAEDNVPSDIKSELSCGIDVVELHDVLAIGSYRARMVWPEAEVDGDGNEDSLCLDVLYAKGPRSLHMLLTGDSEVDQEHEYVDDVGSVDVLKLGHHGSKLSVDKELLEELEPKLCIASAGEGNYYGHPSEECQELIADYGARFLCTIDSGDIVIQATDDGLLVTEKHG